MRSFVSWESTPRVVRVRMLSFSPEDSPSRMAAISLPVVVVMSTRCRPSWIATPPRWAAVRTVAP